MKVKCLDTVRSKISGVVGVVNAIYTIDGVEHIDVRTDLIMVYESPVSNWEVVSNNDKLEGLT